MIATDVKVLILDKPTLNGRIYSTETVTKALLDIDQMLVTNSANSTSLESVVGFATEFAIQDGYLLADIKFIPTPFNNMMYKMVIEHEVFVRPSVTAVIHDNVVDIQTFNNFFLTTHPA